MNDEELLEWYKKNNGARPEGMSDKDYELNMNKAMKLEQQNILNNNLQTQQNTIEKAKNTYLQEASISNDKLMKYLSQNQLASGVAKGQANSAIINANNAYNTNRSEIINNATNKQTELLNNYASDKFAINQNAHNNEVSILDKYRQQAIEDEQLAMEKEKWEYDKEAYNNDNIRQDQQTAYDEIMTTINSGLFNNVAELDTLFEKYKDNLSSTQQQMVQYAIDYYRNNPQQQEIEKNNQENVISSDDILTGKNYLNYNGEDYQIQGGFDLSEEDHVEGLYRTVKEELGKNNPYDSSIKNGTTLKMSDVGKNAMKNKWYVADWYAETFLDDFNEDYYLTYYNGEWYISKKR